MEQGKSWFFWVATDVCTREIGEEWKQVPLLVNDSSYRVVIAACTIYTTQNTVHVIQ